MSKSLENQARSALLRNELAGVRAVNKNAMASRNESMVAACAQRAKELKAEIELTTSNPAMKP